MYAGLVNFEISVKYDTNNFIKENARKFERRPLYKGLHHRAGIIHYFQLSQIFTFLDQPPRHEEEPHSGPDFGKFYEDAEQERAPVSFFL